MKLTIHNIKKLSLIAVWTLLISSAGLTGMPQASAHGTVDQSDLSATANSGASASVGLFQGFTPTSNNLVAVDLNLSCIPGEAVSISIRDNTNPTIPPLGSAPNGVCSNNPTTGIIITHFDFVSPITLVPGNQYFIQLTPFGGVWRASGPNPYPGGIAVVAGTNQPGIDFLFATYTSQVASTQTSSVPVEGTVTVTSSCGLTTSGTLNYGSLAPTQISTDKLLTLSNPGSVPSTVAVSGTNWVDSSVPPQSQMDVGRTKYNVGLPPLPYSPLPPIGKTPLTGLPAVALSSAVPAGGSIQTFWQLQVILNNPSFTGSLTQQVTFTVGC
jgi:hypothetical protein